MILASSPIYGLAPQFRMSTTLRNCSNRLSVLVQRSISFALTDKTAIQEWDTSKHRSVQKVKAVTRLEMDSPFPIKQQEPTPIFKATKVSHF